MNIANNQQAIIVVSRCMKIVEKRVKEQDFISFKTRRKCFQDEEEEGEKVQLLYSFTLLHPLL